ncbi:MAG TPA: hypothetical protein VHD63_01835 [Ktedonobacteraceae bacterium]|nr:hypothetical protein [Ktedonobacteraceae bacterium]
MHITLARVSLLHPGPAGKVLVVNCRIRESEPLKQPTFARPVSVASGHHAPTRASRVATNSRNKQMERAG